MDSETLNQHQLAAHLGRSRSAIIRWGRQGMPISRPGARGKPTLYHLPSVLTWLRETGRGQRPELPALPLGGGAAEGQVPEPAAAQEPAEPIDSGAPDRFGYLEARARREKYQAKIAELEYLERIGRLVDADVTRQFVFGAVRPVRDKLLMVRHLVQANCPELPARAVELIERLHREALEDLAGNFRKGLPVSESTPPEEKGDAP